MYHNPQCRAKRAKQEQLRDAYFLRWPQACEQCNAIGGKEWHGSYWEPPDWDPCPVCTQLNLCPRCKLQFSGTAAEDFQENLITCPMCGYDHGAGNDDYAPIVEDFCQCDDLPY